MKYLLGIDVGTTGTKTILFSDSGEPLRHAYRPYPTEHPNIGESEQNPHHWWQAIIETVREVTPDCGSQVAAISLSTQGGTLVPVDAEGEPVRPAFVWNDYRFTHQREQYLQEVGPAETLYQTCGWKLGSGLPLLAIRYMRDKEPELFAKSEKFLSVPSYVALKMTGNPKVDISNAGIEQLTNIRAFRYDEKLLNFAGIRESQLAEVVPSGTVIGKLTKEAAVAMGLSENVCLVSGAHDQYAAALGAGALQAGDIMIGSGTCWVITALGSNPDFSRGLSQSVSAVPGLWGSLWSLSSGGVCLDWLRKNIAGAENAPLDYDSLNAGISGCKAAEENLFFFPFSGTCGNGKAFTRATFTGLDLSHNRYHAARAVMEGVAFQITWMLEAFPEKPQSLTLTGGASKSPVWAQILSDIAGLPVNIPQVADLGCVGAAILAGTGAGIFQSLQKGYEALAVPTQTIQPANPQYKGLLDIYKQQATALYGVYNPTQE